MAGPKENLIGWKIRKEITTLRILEKSFGMNVSIKLRWLEHKRKSKMNTKGLEEILKAGQQRKLGNRHK